MVEKAPLISIQEQDEEIETVLNSPKVALKSNQGKSKGDSKASEKKQNKDNSFDFK